MHWEQGRTPPFKFEIQSSGKRCMPVADPHSPSAPTPTLFHSSFTDPHSNSSTLPKRTFTCSAHVIRCTPMPSFKFQFQFCTSRKRCEPPPFAVPLFHHHKHKENFLALRGMEEVFKGRTGSALGEEYTPTSQFKIWSSRNTAHWWANLTPLAVLNVKLPLLPCECCTVTLTHIQVYLSPRHHAYVYAKTVLKQNLIFRCPANAANDPFLSNISYVCGRP